MLLKLLKVAMIGAPACVIAGSGMALIEFGEVYIGLSLVLPAIFWGLIFVCEVTE